ncbi:XRE family transcriptional regulator [Priestia megaterium]|uniref:XRE family transcriptional regulator n=1 Tax=Priestia megaterium TaxID=1404 RepID=UPI001FB39E67|nr:XRE family transcriptional regulator [Priestia megaterium]
MIQKRVLKEFNGIKLKQARSIRNMTLQELAQLIGVKHQAISKYENGKSIPNGEKIQLLAKILSFEPSFFYTEGIDSSYFDNSFIFRSKAGIAKKYKEQTQNQMWLVNNMVRNIENKIHLPKFDLSLLRQQTQDHFSPTSEDEIEELAASVRRKFRMGDGPIGNLTAVCEKLGVIISYQNLDHQGIDACSVLIEDRPYIILNNERKSAARIRFNIAHELGHILLHSKYSIREINKNINSKRLEYEANRFAAALLMPESGIAKDLSALGLDFLIILKKHWKVSLQAIIYRAEQLEIFTSEYSLYMRQQISRKKWRNKEPLDDEIPLEKPKLLKHAVQYLNEKHYFSISELSFETGITEMELKMLCSIEDPLAFNSFHKETSNLLKRIK